MTAPSRLSTLKTMHSSQGAYWGEGSGKSPGKSSRGSGGSGRAAVLTYRQTFVDRWQRFCHANFDSPEHAAHVFGVDGTTARKWWDGLHAPSGFVVGYAFQRFPAAALAPLHGAA